MPPAAGCHLDAGDVEVRSVVGRFDPRRQGELKRTRMRRPTHISRTGQVGRMVDPSTLASTVASTPALQAPGMARRAPGGGRFRSRTASGTRRRRRPWRPWPGPRRRRAAGLTPLLRRMLEEVGPKPMPSAPSTIDASRTRLHPPPRGSSTWPKDPRGQGGPRSPCAAHNAGVSVKSARITGRAASRSHRRASRAPARPSRRPGPRSTSSMAASRT